MEMGWLETVVFIGLDLQVGLLLALFGLYVLEHALHSAWSALSKRLSTRRVHPRAPPCVAMGQIQRVWDGR